MSWSKNHQQGKLSKYMLVHDCSKWPLALGTTVISVAQTVQCSHWPWHDHVIDAQGQMLFNVYNESLMFRAESSSILM